MAQSSIAFRAAVAVVLMASFYAPALGVAFFLFLVPWLKFELLGRSSAQLSCHKF